VVLSIFKVFLNFLLTNFKVNAKCYYRSWRWFGNLYFFIWCW